jgi:hypothetical protein
MYGEAEEKQQQEATILGKMRRSSKSIRVTSKK